MLAAGVGALRWSELVGLRVGDIDFLGRRVTVSETIAEVGGRHVAAAPKSNRSTRTLTLPVFLVDELARVFNPAVRRAGLDESLTFHGLHHVATALMVEHGEHPRVIQHRLGQATARLSMELYAHVPEAADRAAAQHLDARFGPQGGHGVARGGSEEGETGT